MIERIPVMIRIDQRLLTMLDMISFTEHISKDDMINKMLEIALEKEIEKNDVLSYLFKE